MIHITSYDLMNGVKFVNVTEDKHVKNRSELEALREEYQERYGCSVFFTYVKK